jgi:amino acid transporter
VSRIIATATLAEPQEPAGLSPQAIASPILVLIHLLGLTMFLGSILGNIVLSLGAPATGDPGAVVFAWRAIASANTFLTIPGLAILIGSGVLLVLAQGRSPRRERWLAFKILAVIGIVVIAAALIEPSEDQLRVLAQSLPDPAARASFTEAAVRQQIYGAVNLALIVLASALVVFKPRLGGVVPRRLRR